MTVGEIIARLIAAFVVGTFASIDLEAPQKLIRVNGPLAVASYSVYLICISYDLGEALAVFLASFVTAVTAQWLARRFKSPVTMFYIPTFFIYVPGSAIYQAAFQFIQGNNVESIFFLADALMIAGAVALGVFISDSIQEIRASLHEKFSKQEQID